MSNGARSRRRSALLLASIGSQDQAEAAGLGQALAEQAFALAGLLPEGWRVLPAMRYGQPTIEQAMAKLESDVEELVVLPMYPQFARATSGLILSEVFRVLGEMQSPVDVATRSVWFNDGGYVNAQARLIASFTSSLELTPPDTQLVLLAHGLEEAGPKSDNNYEKQVEQTAELVLDRLGWPQKNASVVYRSVGHSESPSPSDLSLRLRELAALGHENVVLMPFTFPFDHVDTDGSLEAYCPGNLVENGVQVTAGPALGSYGPFMTAVKNLAIRGPRTVVRGMAGTVPLLAPKTAPENVGGAPRSLVMIGASIAGKVHAQHGPGVVHSPARVVCEVKKTRKELRSFLDWVREETLVEEAFVWSTCQRIEFFGWLSEADDVADHEWPVAEIRRHLFGAEPEGLKVNVLFGVEGWHHLMRTACGLNSALPGDMDVVAQLQTSCRMAERIGTAGSRAINLVESAVALAEELRENTNWQRFSRGFCAAALSRVHDLTGADLDRSRHVVIGGSATSRSVLSTLSERFHVPHRQMTLVYRDHHGQMKLMRSAIGNGSRLRVHSYSDHSVIRAIAEADFVFFGIDHAEPVLSVEMLAGERDFSKRPLVVIDFNDSGSVVDLDTIKGVSVWTAEDLERAVESYAEAMCADSQFSIAEEKAEHWIEARLPGAREDMTADEDEDG
jgi:protoheme ferro-lyase/glutamyl-tRNA reductase